MAIVDDYPLEQFLSLEFELFQKILASHLCSTYIIDAKDLQYKNQELFIIDKDGHKVIIDFVYNRLTDFYLESKEHQNLQSAYEQNACLITPNPYNYAIYANKKNLLFLRDSSFLESLGLDFSTISSLQDVVLRCEPVTEAKKLHLWESRKRLYFKPQKGFGSKAVYRGDKISHKVFDEILRENYLAQEYAPAPLRLVIDENNEKQYLKYDIRVYTYAGSAYLVSARLYQGQATNFRTPHGGFAPVYLIKD